MHGLPCGALGALIVSSLAAGAASAASPEAWEKFRRDVGAACADAVSDQIEDPKAAVDPFGSESYGLALVRGSSTDDGTAVGIICVYDKRSMAVEIGSPLSADELDGR